MGFVEILIISTGLSMDVFAYALSKGAVMPEIKKQNMIKLCGIFTTWQVISMLLGNMLTSIPAIASLAEDAAKRSNGFSIVIFLGLGIYMIVKATREKPTEERKEELVDTKQIIIWACITSLDSFLAGIGFGFLQIDFFVMILVIGIVTCAFVLLGVSIGYWMGCQFKRKAVSIGGCILLFGGVELIIRTIYYGC